ncbi:hypothetical protein EMCRGX_G008266 [Ephydatia muelleri]|eukprot:Em0002g284a
MLSSRVTAFACVVFVASVVWSHAEGACQQGQFDCEGSGAVCISQRKVCDGQKNCAGGQDENPASCGCIQGMGMGPRPGSRKRPAGPGQEQGGLPIGDVARTAGPNNGPGLTRAGTNACVCIASNVSSVVCGCTVGFVPDGQNGCKRVHLPRPLTRQRLSACNVTAPAAPGPRTRAEAGLAGLGPASPGSGPRTRARARPGPAPPGSRPHTRSGPCLRTKPLAEAAPTTAAPAVRVAIPA